MTADIIALDDHRPMDVIATLVLYRDHKGKYQLCVTGADTAFIESHETIPDRFEALGLMCMDGAAWLRRQARNWRRQEREGKND